MADPLETKIQAILTAYTELTATPPDFDDGEELALVFGNKARDENQAHPRISWVETGGTIDPGRGASGDTEPEAASQWARLEVEVWRETVEECRACVWNLIAALTATTAAADYRWSGYRRDEERHKDDGVVFILDVSLRQPVPLHGTRGAVKAQIKHHRGEFSPDTTVNVAGDAYEQLLWLGARVPGQAKLYGFNASRLTESSEGAANRIITVTLPALGSRYVYGCTFDAAGNLWAVASGEAPSYVVKLTPAQLLSTATVTPAVVLTMPSGTGGARSCRFDRHGNLWVIDSENFIWRFAAADITTTGTPTPAAEITLIYDHGSLVDLAFDGRDNLYVSIFDDTGPPLENILFKITPIDQESVTELTPPGRIGQFDLGNTRGYRGIALDPDGRRFWVASFPVGDHQNNRLLAYSLDQFDREQVDPTPIVQLFPIWPDTDIVEPNGIAFDQSGNLWFSSWSGDHTLSRVPANKLKNSGSVTPDVTIDASIDQAGYLAFQTLAL